MSLEVFGRVDLSEDADKEHSLGTLESFEDKFWLFSKESGEVPDGNVASDICEWGPDVKEDSILLTWLSLLEIV